MRRRNQITSYVNERECDVAGQDPATIKRLTARFHRLATECQELGITIFGGSGSGSLRGEDANKPARLVDRKLILAHIGGPWDGGDGGASTDDDGLERGEGV